MEINFEDWKKLDIRVGTIVSAEDHPNADKLLILKVDVGEEKQLVAGLKEYYKKEDLIGKKIIVFTNLKPVKLRGIDSNGMVLAAVNKGNVSLLTTDKKINNGARIE